MVDIAQLTISSDTHTQTLRSRRSRKMFEFATLLSIACRIVCSASLVKSPPDPKNKPFFVFIYDYSTEIGVSAWKLRRCVLGIALILCVYELYIFGEKGNTLFTLLTGTDTPV